MLCTEIPKAVQIQDPVGFLSDALIFICLINQTSLVCGSFFFFFKGG